MKILSKKNGITLLVLIITIITIIIVSSAIIVTTYNDTGIINKAKENVFKADMSSYQNALAVLKAQAKIRGESISNLNAETLEEIKAIIPDFKAEYKDLVIIKNGKLELGEKLLEEELEGVNAKYKEWLIGLGVETTRLLPAGYTQLAYIESTGTQYIDTGIFRRNWSNILYRYAVDKYRCR